MQSIESNEALAGTLRGWRDAGEPVVFVPTMGNLHAGHLRLVERACQLGGRVVVSIFVNPTQFTPGEDYERYPRTLDADRRALGEYEVDVLYTPGVDALYPYGIDGAVAVEVPALSADLCGAQRPGHFRGVATVVAKLFNLVRPDVAVFGEKDYQQLLIVRRMAAELFMPVRIEAVATVREPDGLALSSRNAYLTDAERRVAPRLYATLVEAAERLRDGVRDWPGVEAAGAEQLKAAGFEPEYFSVRRASDLAPPDAATREVVVLAAAHLGRARLIDNVRVTLGRTEARA